MLIFSTSMKFGENAILSFVHQLFHHPRKISRLFPQYGGLVQGRDPAQFIQLLHIGPQGLVSFQVISRLSRQRAAFAD